MKKKITPSMAIANRFFPTMSQARGERKRFSPVETQNGNGGETPKASRDLIFTCIVKKKRKGGLRQIIMVSEITKSLQSVGHRLILHHVNQPSAQTEVREDEEDVLQDVVDATDFLNG